MDINIKDKITLDDDKEFYVASKLEYEGKTYYYLISTDKEIIMFCYEDKDDLVEIKDAELIMKLLPAFTKITSKILKEEQ